MQVLLNIIADAIFAYAYSRAKDLIVDPVTNQLRPEFQAKLEQRLSEGP